MSRGYKPEHIISMLREAEVRLSQGKDGRPGMSFAGRLGAELLSMASRVWRFAGRSGEAVEGS